MWVRNRVSGEGRDVELICTKLKLVRGKDHAIVGSGMDADASPRRIGVTRPQQLQQGQRRQV